MPRLSPRAFSSRRPSWRTLVRGAVWLAISLSAAGCAGDFGRPRKLFDTDTQSNIIARLGDSETTTTFAALTDDERRLRDVAYSILISPEGGDTLRRSIPVEIDYAAVLETAPRSFDRSEYARKLVSYPVRSEEVRYNRLLEDVRNDLEQMDQFFALARRVADMDRRREQSLAYVTDLSPVELAQARDRIHRNRLIVERVMTALDEHAAGYRYALERLAISAPSPAAAEADSAVNELKRRIAQGRAPAVVLRRAA